MSNGIEMSLIFLQTVLASFPAPVVFRRWRNVIVVKIILCSELAEPDCEEGRWDKWQLHLSGSPLRPADLTTQSNV